MFWNIARSRKGSSVYFALPLCVVGFPYSAGGHEVQTFFAEKQLEQLGQEIIL